MALCPTHKVEFRWREGGISKQTGKAYSGFWSCPEKVNEKWCIQKPPQPATAAERFSEGLEREIAQEKQTKKELQKDESIARAVALKAAVDFYGGQPTTENAVIGTAEVFFEWLLV